MKLFKITQNWTFGIDFGDSGCYFYFYCWCRTRYAEKSYGLGEIRLYRPQWWKTYYDKKGKVIWEGTVLEKKG